MRGAAELADLIRAREVSPVEVVQSFLEQEDTVNAIVARAPDVHERAQAAEATIRRGEDVGLLHGVPFTAKDTFDTAGLRTTRGSRLFANNLPDRDAAAVALLKAAGAILLGKTNTPEFALWWETENLVYGRTLNPFDPARTPGGSSGGEAAALAAGLTPLGLGSDLGGSIRLPAAWCGVVGLKPTHGRVPLDGHWPETLLGWMHVGPLACTVADVRLALRVLSPRPGRAMKARRVGLVVDAFGEVNPEVASSVRRAGELLDAAETELPVPDCNELTLLLYGAGSADYFAAAIDGRWDELHPFLRDRLTRRAAADTAEIEAGYAQVEGLRRALDEFFVVYDLLLCPTALCTAPLHGESTRVVMRATIPFDLTGSPAVSVPFGSDAEGLPIGVQLVGRPFEDETVLDAAAVLEAA